MALYAARGALGAMRMGRFLYQNPGWIRPVARYAGTRALQYARSAQGLATLAPIGASAASSAQNFFNKRGRTASPPSYRGHARPRLVSVAPRAGGRNMYTSGKYKNMSSRKSNTVTATSYKRFKKASRKGINVMKQYHTKGYVDTVEINGTINDPDCVYIGHVAQANVQTMDTMVRALIRKLFMKCVKYEGISSNEEIPGNWWDDTGDVYRILLLQKDQDTNVISIAHSEEPPGNSTIKSVANAFAPEFRKYANGFTVFTNSYKTVPFKLQLYKRDTTAVFHAWSFVGELNLQDLVVHVNCKSTIKIQNRTESATGSADAEDVNNNPLIGRRYITRGLPKTRDEVGVFGQVSTNGVKLLRAGQLPGTSKLQEPPAPGYFVNVSATTGIKIMPGGIKYGTVTFMKNASFLSFLKMMRYDQTDNSLITYNIGPVDIYALEDAINVNGEEKIQVAYEVNRVTGLFFTEKRKAYSIGDFQAISQNNVT